MQSFTIPIKSTWTTGAHCSLVVSRTVVHSIERVIKIKDIIIHRFTIYSRLKPLSQSISSVVRPHKSYDVSKSYDFFTVAIQWSSCCTTSTTLHDRRTKSRANYRTTKHATLRQLVQLLQRCAIGRTRLVRDSHERCTTYISAIRPISFYQDAAKKEDPW